MQVFVEESLPVIEMLKESGRVTEIDATVDEDAIFAAIEPFMDAVQEKGELGGGTEGPSQIMCVLLSGHVCSNGATVSVCGNQ